MEADFLSGAIELLKSYGVDQGQLALVTASLAAMLGMKVSYRVSAYAFGQAAGLATRAVRWAFAGPERSAAYDAAMKALQDESAVIDEAGALVCTGLHVRFDGERVRSAAAGNKLSLLPLLTKKERAAFVKAALARLDEVAERERADANVRAAAAIEVAQARAAKACGQSIDVRP